jgi:hypothetical protein
MGMQDMSRARETVLIWLTALTLFGAGLRQAQRLAPGAFAEARAQLAVEARELRWTAEGAQSPVALAGFGGSSLLADAVLRGHVRVRRDDLLERTSTGLR